jgi:hypothetical protein
VARSNASTAWLDAALAGQLEPVSAPTELWDRVRTPRAATSSVSTMRAAIPSLEWRLARASMLAILTVAALWAFRQHGPARQEFRSTNAMAMRAWVKSRTGLDIPLADGGSPLIRLATARLENGAQTAAEVSFLVGNRRATLQVSPAAPASGVLGHGSLAAGTYQGSRTASWVVRGQLYTLACATPEDLRIACSLCHMAGAL